MKYLLDTNILLRMVHPTDPQHQEVIDALVALKDEAHTFYCGMQNAAEFWNAATRPLTSRGGFGLTPQEADHRLQIIERGVEVLTDSPASYAHWRRLVVRHAVCGVQVHDTKLAALMETENVTHLLTLNPSDFKRFTQLTVLTPRQVLDVRTPPH